MTGAFARFAFVTLATVLFSGSVSAQYVPEWQDEALKSIARIETQRCAGACEDPETDRFVRRGTGFVAEIQGMSSPVLVTALHLVAGANWITYQFTESGEEKVPAQVLAIDKDNDLAVIGLSSDTSTHPPLKFQTTLPADNQVVVYGYKMGDAHPESDQGLVKFKAPQTLGNAPIGKDAKDEISRLEYPSLGMIIVGLEQALDPGDSGAPVFNSSGELVGMGQGGLQGAQLSWMVPASTLSSLTLNPDDGSHLGIFGFHDFFAARNAFYDDLVRTKFGSEPMARFSFEWRTSLPVLQDWGRQMDEASRADLQLLGTVYNAPHMTARVEPSNAVFPSAGDPFRVAIANAALSVICYRAEVFEGLLKGEIKDLPQADLELQLPLGKFADTPADDGLGLGYSWNGPSSDSVVLFTNGPLKYRSGIGEYHRHPEIQTIEDLYGGACRIKLEATNPQQESEVAQLDHALRMRGACVHLFLSPNTHMPVSFTGYLPLGDSLSDGELWGILPDFEPAGTEDDLACM